MKRAASTTIVSYFHLKKESLECQRCHNRFLGQSKLDKHINICKQWKCVVCLKTFLSSETFERHLRSNCPPKRFKCVKCEKTYSRSSDKNSHELKCLGIPKNQRDICKKSFPDLDIIENPTSTERENDSKAIPVPNTFVFLDLETTGLPEGDQFPQITELSLLAVHIENLDNIAFNNTPRVINKLQLTFSPTKLITPGATLITGEMSIFCHSLYTDKYMPILWI